MATDRHELMAHGSELYSHPVIHLLRWCVCYN